MFKIKAIVAGPAARGTAGVQAPIQSEDLPYCRQAVPGATRGVQGAPLRQRREGLRAADAGSAPRAIRGFHSRTITSRSRSREDGEYLLAAGTYNRLIDAFPQDTLVDDAFYLSGHCLRARVETAAAGPDVRSQCPDRVSVAARQLSRFPMLPGEERARQAR